MPLNRPPGPARLPGLGAPALGPLEQAVQAFNARRWGDAEALARRVTALRPEDPSALNILGGVAMNTGRAAEGVPLLERAARGQPKNPFIAFNLGEALRRCGRYGEAAGAFRRALRAKPDFAEASAQLGEALRGLEDWEAAEAAYRRALALQPRHVTALAGLAFIARAGGRLDLAIAGLNQAQASVREPAARAALLASLAGVLLEAGAQPDALGALSEAMALDPQPSYARRLARALSHTRVVPAHPRFRSQLLALFGRDDVNPRSLATAALAVLRSETIVAELLASIQAQPNAVTDLTGGARETSLRLLEDDLFRALLVSAPAPDVAVELLLTALRRDLLLEAAEAAEAASDMDGAGDLDLVCALAQQCFLNEYVYAVTPAERDAEGLLLARLANASTPDWRTAALLACYRPLEQITSLQSWPPEAPAALQPLWRQQVAEPRQERVMAAAIPQLAPEHDLVSRAVRAQYEANPYPRWTRCQVGEPAAFKEAVQAALPHLAAHELPALAAPEILVAGCGTGLETMRVVNSYRGARVLAVDLSLASLAYGKRKLEEYGVQNVELMQADILDLDRLEQSFDVVESFGVIHHMADPGKGLECLARRLKAGGLMRLGLYSEMARQGVVAARRLIAERGFAADAEGVRALRRELMTAPDLAPELGGLLSPASDFWTTSDCRDLIFHVEEHRFTLRQIDEIAGQSGLQFLGLELRRAADRLRFQGEFPDPASVRSLEAWHAFEARHPDTFGETYCLWLQAPATP